MGEITMNLRLVFQIPESGLTINGLIEGLKKGSFEIHGAILSNLMKAIEEQLIEHMVQKDPGRIRRNGYQSKPRHLRCSLGTIAYRFAQLIDQQEKRTLMPLVKALSIPAYDHYLEDAMGDIFDQTTCPRTNEVRAYPRRDRRPRNSRCRINPGGVK